MRKSSRPQSQHRTDRTSSVPSNPSVTEHVPGEPADTPSTTSGKRGSLSKAFLPTTGLVAIAALAYFGHTLRQPAPIISKPTLVLPQPTPTIAAGTPLEEDTHIEVLTPPSTASITVLSPSTPPPTDAITYPAPYNDTTLRLGVTLNLLQQAIASGQPSAQSLANNAATLAKQAQRNDLATVLTTLAQRLPASGPVTLTALIAEATRLEALGAPTLVTPTISPTATTSSTAPVWRKLVGQLVTIKPVTSTTNPQADTWTNAIGIVRQTLALNHAPDAFFTLNQPPLNTDPRLSTLTSLIRDYAETQHQLSLVLEAYTNSLLSPPDSPPNSPTRGD